MIAWSSTLVATCSYVVEINMFVHSNQVTEVKMTVHIRFVNLSTAVTTDDIPSQMTEAKITVHIDF